MPTASVPLLSEHKTTFVWNRFFETLLGGFRAFLGNSVSDVPLYVYVLQFIVHQFPFFLGALFTTLSQSGVLTTLIAAISCSIVAAVVALAAQTLSLCTHRDVSKVSAVPADPKRLSAGHLLEDDDVEVFESCFSVQMIRFLFPRKRYLVNSVMHALLWGIVSGYGVAYLEPSWLEDLFGSSTTAYFLFFFGWIVVCISSYSLIGRVPAEPATFHPLDSLEIRPLNRPFYLVVFYALDLSCRCTGQYYEVASISHFVFMLLPLLWFLNLLPPLDALVLWGCEQFLFVVAGGTATSKFKWMMLQLVQWFVAVCIVYFIPSNIAQTVVSTVFGYFLSLDFVGLTMSSLTWKSSGLCKGKSGKLNVNDNHGKTFKFRWNHKDLMFFICVLLLLCITSVVINCVMIDTSPDVLNYVVTTLQMCLLLCLVFAWIVSSVQSVYVCAGLFRNSLYPTNVRIESRFLSRLNKLRLFGKFRCVLLTIVVPFLLVAYLSFVELDYRIASRSNSFTLIHVVCVLRAFRWLWQQTECALFEAVIVYLATLVANLLFATDKFLLLLLAAFAHNRLLSFTSKLHVAATILFASVTQDKQKRHYSWFLFGLNVVGFPFVILIVMISSLLWAPLLPLFTLPLFWVGFPRPVCFWPKQQDEDAVSTSPSSDSIYYEEIIPELIPGLEDCLASGSLGRVSPGDHFLLRYDDRLALLSVLGGGYCHLVAKLKGLELQQTSCHALEASTVDAILERAFELNDTNQKKSVATMATSCFFNVDAFHVFRPLDTAIVETYVDTRNVLTGVINSVETLQLIMDSFPKCLVWILLHQFMSGQSDMVTSVMNDAATPVRASAESEDSEVVFISQPPKLEKGETPSSKSRPSTAERYAQLPRVSSLHKLIRRLSTSTTDDRDSWQDEDDLLGAVESSAKFSNCAFPDDEVEPAAVLTIPVLAEPTVPGAVPHEDDASDLPASGDDLGKLQDVHNIPAEWLRCPVPDDHFRFAENLFPSTWFRFVYDKCSRSVEVEDFVASEAVYRRVVLGCHVIVNQVRTTGRRMSIGPSMVSRIFAGDLPWSPYSEWLAQQKTLHELVTKAYRYACKVALDQALLGEAECDSELADYLEEYDRSWHIGCDSDPAWIEAVRQRVPNLFSLEYSPILWTHTSHLLTRRKVPVFLGRLNAEVVRSIWSTLSLELLYLTNDDEERYSIQAHSGILRNLVVQSADPPLGYPIYTSPTFLLRLTPVSVFCGATKSQSFVS